MVGKLRAYHIACPTRFSAEHFVACDEVKSAWSIAAWRWRL